MEQNDGAVMLQVNYDNDSETSIAADWNAICEKLDGSKIDGIAFLYPVSSDIKALAAKCVGTKVYNQVAADVEAMIVSVEAEKKEKEQRLTHVWNWMSFKMETAPTGLHTRLALVMCFPLLARYLPDVETLNGVDTK